MDYKAKKPLMDLQKWNEIQKQKDALKEFKNEELEELHLRIYEERIRRGIVKAISELANAIQ